MLRKINVLYWIGLAGMCIGSWCFGRMTRIATDLANNA